MTVSFAVSDSWRGPTPFLKTAGEEMTLPAILQGLESGIKVPVLRQMPYAILAHEKDDPISPSSLHSRAPIFGVVSVLPVSFSYLSPL